MRSTSTRQLAPTNAIAMRKAARMRPLRRFSGEDTGGKEGVRFCCVGLVPVVGTPSAGMGTTRTRGWAGDIKGLLDDEK